MSLVVQIPTTPDDEGAYRRLRAASRAGFEFPTRHQVTEDALFGAVRAVDDCGWDAARYLSVLGYGVVTVPSSPTALERAPRERRMLTPDEAEWIAEVTSDTYANATTAGDWPRHHLAELGRLCYAAVALSVPVSASPP